MCYTNYSYLKMLVLFKKKKIIKIVDTGTTVRLSDILCNDVIDTTSGHRSNWVKRSIYSWLFLSRVKHVLWSNLHLQINGDSEGHVVISHSKVGSSGGQIKVKSGRNLELHNWYCSTKRVISQCSSSQESKFQWWSLLYACGLEKTKSDVWTS